MFTVSVPAESSFDMIALLMRVASDNVFNRSSQDVTVMRKSSSERRSIVESITAKCSELHQQKIPITCNVNSPRLRFRLF